MFKPLVKMKTIVKIFSGTIAMLAIPTIFISHPTYACDGHGNSAMIDGCAHLDVIGSPGAAWINGSPDFNYSETVTIDNPNTNSVRVYLHGALYNYMAGYENWANDVKLCSQTNGRDTRSSDENQCNDWDKPAYITDYAHTFFRGYGKAYDWSDGQENYSGFIDIDLESFKNTANKEADGDYDKYTAWVWISRCPNTISGSACSSGTTYRADQSAITIRIKRAIKTTFQGHTTASIGRGSDKVAVKSGWDDFNSGQYTSDQDSNQFTISFTHKIRRRDRAESPTAVKWKLATARGDGLNSLVGNNDDRTMQFSAEEKNGAEGAKKVAETTSYTVNVGLGKTKTFCQGINHENEVYVSPEGNVLEGQNPSRSEAKACITINHIGSGKEHRSSATTNPSYIGEQSTIEKTGAHTIYFYVSKSTAQPSDEQVQNNNAKQYYGEGDKNSPGDDDGTDYNDAICSHYSTFCRNDNYKDANSGSTPIDDDENLVGAKICAASSSRNSEFNDKWGTRSKTISRLNNEGNTVTETITESYQIFDYYWAFSDLSCSPIYKKPIARATNGSVFSTYKITSNISSKITGSMSGKTFSSWSEYLAIAGDSIKNFGSGAALRNGSDTNAPQANSPLSIANNKANDIGHSGITQLPLTFLNNLKNYVISTNRVYPSDKIKVYNNAGQTVSVSDFDLPANRINIIYAKNINIPNNITSVNAWLIADGGTINTCSGYRIGADEDGLIGISATRCDNPLTINGAVYANKYKLYRTYGAGSGNNSSTSAETFNLTANDYRYAFEAVSGNRIQPNEVYTQELAPRM